MVERVSAIRCRLNAVRCGAFARQSRPALAQVLNVKASWVLIAQVDRPKFGSRKTVQGVARLHVDEEKSSILA